MNNQLEKNKTVVKDFYNLALNMNKPEEAVARYLGPYYRQHNPSAGDGPGPFIKFVKDFSEAFPSLHFDLGDSSQKVTVWALKIIKKIIARRNA